MASEFWSTALGGALAIAGAVAGGVIGAWLQGRWTKKVALELSMLERQAETALELSERLSHALDYLQQNRQSFARDRSTQLGKAWHHIRERLDAADEIYRGRGQWRIQDKRLHREYRALYVTYRTGPPDGTPDEMDAWFGELEELLKGVIFRVLEVTAHGGRSFRPVVQVPSGTEGGHE